MKRNAIIRIILWSLVIVVLSTVLASVLFGWTLRDRRLFDLSEAPLETLAADIDVVYDGKSIFSPTDIREIEIEWVAGDILIQSADTEEITVKEDGYSNPEDAMILRHHEDTLKIQFCEDAIDGMGIGFNNSDITKDLTILVPRDWELGSLEIDCASATVEVNHMIIREVDFDGASGTCEFEECTVEEMDIDTASGDIRFIGNLGMLDCDAASASVYAVLTNTPSRLDMDSMSGDLEIVLPSDAGFTLSMSTMSGSFETEFETTQKHGNHICGDGRCRINLDALSGDVIIRKDDSMITPGS